ncbi:MAG: uroporphyrinogen decarboxylase, partial [Gemmatimonadetes bacterium]|nr:uroporphyrinogen decarboxylase [Gemmatimonadota bacterium]
VIHFGTGTSMLLEFMAQAGGDVIGVDWRISLDVAWSRLPGHGIQGNLDPAALLGPVPALEAKVRDILRRAAGRSGHVFNLGHGVLQQTDPERLRAVVDMVHEWSAAGV